MRLLALCPIPVEYSACRSALSLRDLPDVAGRRACYGVLGEAELFAVETGPGKARAAASAAFGIQRLRPDLLLDSGSCAGIEPDAVIGEIVAARECYEVDLAGTPFPRRVLPEMRLDSAFSLLPPEAAAPLLKEAVELGRAAGWAVRLGIQACGEFLIHSEPLRAELHGIFRAAAANWETAGVFIAALKASLPALSFRVITDLGNQYALRDFRRQVRPRSRQLYEFLGELARSGWFGRFLKQWGGLGRPFLDGLPARVLP
jgi:adenosylhomocysteine nucleosidase